MNSNLERKIERLEQTVGFSGCDDPRIYTYPNSLVEGIIMASMGEEKLQQYLRTRRRRPSPEVCDQFDELFEQMRKGNKLKNRKRIDYSHTK